ncbi:MAG: hypothetical protein LQ337_007105 [Flavoplaca oasis]|nr:MAG: hypothetical protein LQ337_007105 [Flavoplaca oasis]
MAQASGDAITSSSEPSSYLPVTDGEIDIAVTMDGEKMKVQAPGRQPMQHVYLWEGSKDGAAKKRDRGAGFTNKPYKPEEDGPAVVEQGGRLPTGDELQPGTNAVRYLEVGLVIGDKPDMYKPTKATSTKTAQDQRVRRGEMQRARSAIRAFIPVTENIPTQSKYYVGVKPSGGRLNPRLIDGEVIFFYPEFWQGCAAGASKHDRRNFVNQKTKHLAGVNKTQAERATAAITVDDMARWTASNPLTVTQPENLANTLVIQYTLYQYTGDRSYLRNMLGEIEGAAPDLKNGPHTATDGVKTFLDFSEDLSEQGARLVAAEMKNAVPVMPDLRVDVLQAVHRIIKEGNHGARLPYRDLAFFLELCNHNIPSLILGEQEVAKEVERALQTVEIADHHRTGRTTSNHEPITKENYRLVLSCMKDTIDQIITFIKDSGQQVAQQHGGVLKHAGIKDLMNKFSNAVDVVHQQSLFEQLANVHAVQHTSANSKASEKLLDLSELIGKVLSVRDQ